MPQALHEKPEMLGIFQCFEGYISAGTETVAEEHEKLATLASGLEYANVCYMRDWFFENRGQFFGASKLRTFEAYAVFRNVADIRRTEALFAPMQNA